MSIKQAIDAMPEASKGPWEIFNRGDYSDYGGDSRIILGEDRRVAVVIDDGSEETKANSTIIFAAPAMAAWIQKALPYMKLDLERRKFSDYDDSENKAYADRDIANLTALIAEATR